MLGIAPREPTFFGFGSTDEPSDRLPGELHGGVELRDRADSESRIRRSKGVVVHRGLPPQVHDVLDEMVVSPNASVVVLPWSCPLDGMLPTTPPDGLQSPVKLNCVSELPLVGVATMRGEPFGFAAEKPELVGNMASAV